MTTIENSIDIAPTADAVRMSKFDAIIQAGIGGIVAERLGGGTDFTGYRVVAYNPDMAVNEQVTFQYVTSDHGATFTTSLIGTVRDDADRWHIVEKSDTPIDLMTMLRWFQNEVTIGDFVQEKNNRRERWIYTFAGIGILNWDTMEQAIFLWNSYSGSLEAFLEKDNKLPNKWEKTTLDGDASAPNSQYNLLTSCVGMKADLIATRRSVSELQVQTGTLIKDFEKVNEKINAYAEEMSMCGDYESRIFSWNEELTTKLVGRERNWSVPVSCDFIESPCGDTTYVVVRARSKENAIAIVQEKKQAELIGLLLDNGNRLKSDSPMIVISGDPLM